MPTHFNQVYIDSSGYFLPGEAVANDDIDAYIAPINKVASRIKNRVLAENGIQTRHYAIDKNGKTIYSNVQLAENAVNNTLEKSNLQIDDIELLATGTSGGDNAMPGFSNMLQGEMAAPPMATYSSNGICMAGVSAMAHAASQIELGAYRTAMVVGTDLPSRLFKASRFSPQGYGADFGAHFLRWMLSDGAGALLLSNRANDSNPLRIKLQWIHQKSFSGDYPVCMQFGSAKTGNKTYLDYPSCGEAEIEGAMALRQDIRLLPHLFDVAIHEYVSLVKGNVMHSDNVDHFLCHYSSEKFIPVVEELMANANLSIPKRKWYSNLAWRGNTGAASIFIMLAEFLETHELKAGEKILCFIPESGRFSVGFMMFEVVDAANDTATIADRGAKSPDPIAQRTEDLVAPPHNPDDASGALATLLQELAQIWHDYRSRAWRSDLIRRIREQRLTVADYLHWMEHWIPQVREGSLWMREATANIRTPYGGLISIITQHADEEQFDYNILFDDYRLAGGTVANIDLLKRNPGGEALNSYLHAYATQINAVGMLGAIYVIEGTGQRIIPALLPDLKGQLDLPATSFRFLEYHGENDENHLNRWLEAVKLVMAIDVDAARDIVSTAKRTAELYLMQLESV